MDPEAAEGRRGDDVQCRGDGLIGAVPTNAPSRDDGAQGGDGLVQLLVVVPAADVHRVGRALGATVEAVLCVIDRSAGDTPGWTRSASRRSPSSGPRTWPD